MRIRITVLFICLILMFSVSVTAEEIRHTEDGFEYTLCDSCACVTGYHGKYLPRRLPEELDGFKIDRSVSYDDEMFKDLIREHGIFRYGFVAENEICIVGWTGFERICYIPETIDAVPVTGIGDFAFYCSGFTREFFADIVIVPGSVRYIGTCAFACTSVSHIVLNDGLEEIGDFAFQGLSQSNLSIPSTVRKMGVNPFLDFTVMFEDRNGFLFPAVSADNDHFETDFDLYGFRMLYSKEDMRLIHCTGNLICYPDHATVYTVPEGIRVIDQYSFCYVPYLTKVVLPDSLTEIRSYAFYNSPVKEVEIPPNVTVFGEDIFDGSGTIICEKGSAAEKYAVEHGYEVRYR